MILDKAEIKKKYSTNEVLDDELILQLANALHDEIEAGSKAKLGMQHYIKLWEREKGVVDRLIESMGSSGKVSAERHGDYKVNHGTFKG